jgi:hypothetical protein
MQSFQRNHVDASNGSAKDAILKAHNDVYRSDSPRQKYYWLDFAAARLADAWQAKAGITDTSDPSLSYRLQAIGWSLHKYHQQTPKETAELAERISANYRHNLQSESSGRLFAGLPTTFEYFERRILYASSENQTASSLERNWLTLDPEIHSDAVLRREYAILINRHASFIRADWHLHSFDCGVARDKSLRDALKIYTRIRRGISAAAAISAIGLIWLGSNSNEGFLASILAVILLGFCYAIMNRLYDKEQAWWDRAIGDLVEFVRLEKALHAAETNLDLYRCAALANRLFEKGFIEMRYVLSVIAAPSLHPNRDEA